MRVNVSGRRAAPVVAGLVTILAIAPGTALAGDPAVSGDFNGDGIGDLAIGAPGDDVAGRRGAGVVHVLFGAADGLRPAGDQLWHQDRNGVPDAAEAGDHFGAALAAGDFDLDGFEDLAIGVPDEDLVVTAVTAARARAAGLRPAGGGLGPVKNAGGVLVLRGGPGGLTTTGRVWLAPAYDAPGQAKSRYGATLATGDLVGDLDEDLVVAIPGLDGGRGTVRIYDEACVEAVVCGVTSYAFHEQDAGARAGTALAVGQFDGAGSLDLAIGVPYADSDGLFAPVTDSGIVRIVFPGGGGPQTIAQGGSLGDAREAKDHFGMALGALSLQGDDQDALVIGVPDEDVGGKQDAGMIHIRGWGNLDQGSARVPGSRAAKARFGARFATGDLGGTSTPDLAVGVPGWNRPGAARAGAVAVLFGDKSDGPGAGPLLTQDTAGMLDAAEKDDRFGSTVAIAQLGRSSRDDLVIGVPRESVDGKARAGQVHVLYGTSGGPSTGNDQRWNQATPGIAEGVGRDDRFGAALP